MFDLQKFYEDAHQGNPLDVAGLVGYLKSYGNLYVWGGGNLGSDIGKKLLELGIPITAYWDTRASSIGSLHGIKVVEPFQTEGTREDTVVVFCITSSFVQEHCLHEVRNHGFLNIVKGDHLYEGLVCTFNDETRFKECRDAKACDVYTCLKNETFHKRYLGVDKMPPQQRLYFKNITFVINQICTLKCKYCYSYTNAYSKDRKINFPVEQILSDIDKTFDSIDGVKIVPLIGGETFLHPDVDRIVKKFLEKSNFGVLNVTTNGICKIRDKHLAVLQDHRIQVVFSNYKSSLPANECDIFDKNVERVQKSGAQVIVLNETPQWTIPTTLWNRNYPLEVMKAKRKICLNPLVCKYVKNGKFFSCTVADSIYNIGVANYPEDYIALETTLSREDIRTAIHRLLNRSYFDSCRHCDGICGTNGVTAKAGEQGFYDVIKMRYYASKTTCACTAIPN
jgi:organic radical activating enzyme